MPFSDEEEIVEVRKSKLKTFILASGITLFAISLLNTGFCTDNRCKTSIEILLTGWLGLLTGGAGLTWLANPVLFICWILIAKNKKIAACICGLLATLISLSFLKFHVVIENEAGHYGVISEFRLGYWLWLSSCIATFVGSLVIQISNKRHKTLL